MAGKKKMAAYGVAKSIIGPVCQGEILLVIGIGGAQK